MVEVTYKSPSSTRGLICGRLGEVVAHGGSTALDCMIITPSSTLVQFLQSVLIPLTNVTYDQLNTRLSKSQAEADKLNFSQSMGISIVIGLFYRFCFRLGKLHGKRQSHKRSKKKMETYSDSVALMTFLRLGHKRSRRIRLRLRLRLLLLFYPTFKTWKQCLCLPRLAVANPGFLKKWGDAH